LFPFSGKSIPGVCHAQKLAFEKAGKWSNSTWAIEHRPSTIVVAWHDDWDTGRAWPQATWEEGLLWLAEKASAANMGQFQAAHRAWASEEFMGKYVFPSAAKRWDAAEMAKDEFSEPLPIVVAEDIEALRAAVAEEKAKQRDLAEKIAAAKAAREEKISLEKKLEKERAFTAGQWSALEALN